MWGFGFCSSKFPLWKKNHIFPLFFLWRILNQISVFKENPLYCYNIFRNPSSDRGVNNFWTWSLTVFFMVFHAASQTVKDAELAVDSIGYCTVRESSTVWLMSVHCSSIMLSQLETVHVNSWVKNGNTNS